LVVPLAAFLRLPAQGVNVVGEVRELDLSRGDDLLDGHLASGRVPFGDRAEGVVGFLDAPEVFDSFCRPVSSGEHPQQVAEVSCDETPRWPSEPR